MTDTTEHDAMNDAIRAKSGHSQQPDETDEQAGEQQQAVPSFDGGAREAAPKPKDMNQLIRQATGYGR